MNKKELQKLKEEAMKIEIKRIEEMKKARKNIEKSALEYEFERVEEMRNHKRK